MLLVKGDYNSNSGRPNQDLFHLLETRNKISHTQDRAVCCSREPKNSSQSSVWVPRLSTQKMLRPSCSVVARTVATAEGKHQKIVAVVTQVCVKGRGTLRETKTQHSYIYRMPFSLS